MKLVRAIGWAVAGNLSFSLWYGVFDEFYDEFVYHFVHAIDRKKNITVAVGTILGFIRGWTGTPIMDLVKCESGKLGWR
jgi:hypothetical protein